MAEAFRTVWTDGPEPTHGILIRPDELSAWAGRDLTRAQVSRIAEAISHSSVPEAISTISLAIGEG